MHVSVFWRRRIVSSLFIWFGAESFLFLAMTEDAIAVSSFRADLVFTLAKCGLWIINLTASIYSKIGQCET